MEKYCEYRVAKRELGEKIVPGKSARWWEREVQWDKIKSRRKLYKSMLDVSVDAQDDYCKLQNEVKGDRYME